jgi:uridine monophosphate synthetase
MELIESLHQIGAVKFSHFTLKSGQSSPVYIDLRSLVSYPKLMEAVADHLWDKISNLHFDLICGVPYTALPIATVLAYKHRLPMVMRRKESKDYGTKKRVEGVFEKGQKCLLIEDVVTTGSSILETIADLEQAGLQVTDVCSLIDREQGGQEALGSHGYTFHPVFKLSTILKRIENAALT